MQLLSAATLGQLLPHVRRPGYDRGAIGVGIVNLGISAFHRAHPAVYTEAVLEACDPRWGIASVSLRSPATRDALPPQDGLYTLNQRGTGDDLQGVGRITRLLVAPEARGAVLDALAAPATRIVTLTVPEKAYCRDPASGALDEAHPDVRSDLANTVFSRSVLELLAAVHPPFAVLCYHPPANGRTVHGLLIDFARFYDPDLAAFVTGEVACPDTMVDRIVPATTDADRDRVGAALGLRDAWPVVAEPFSQRVIEDRFPAGRHEWERAGATMVGEVTPFEAMKLRLLNAAHTGLAYLGYLAGAHTVAGATAMPELAGFATRLMAAAATLAVPFGTDVANYSRALIDSFHNPALGHPTWQIAMDGSQKLPPRILATITDRLAQGLPIDAHVLVVAG